MKINSQVYNESNTRRITIEESKIIFELTRDGVKDYVTYTDDLYKILCMNSLKPFRDNGRLRFKVRRDGADVNFYFYDLAYGCYTGQIKADNFLDDLQKFYDYKSSHGLSIDHADNNVHNNTVLNISLMSLPLNQSKSEIVAHFTPPFCLNSVYHGGKYRVQMLCAVEQPYLQKVLIRSEYCLSTLRGGIAAMHFLCDTPEDYVACLKYLANTSYEWGNGMGSPQNHWRSDKSRLYWAGDIKRSLHAQSVLVQMGENEFQLFCA